MKSVAFVGCNSMAHVLRASILGMTARYVWGPPLTLLAIAEMRVSQ